MSTILSEVFYLNEINGPDDPFYYEVKSGEAYHVPLDHRGLVGPGSRYYHIGNKRVLHYFKKSIGRDRDIVIKRVKGLRRQKDPSCKSES